MRKLVIGLAALAAAASPVAAQHAVGSLTRDSAPVADANEIGTNDLFFFAGIAAVAVAVALLSESSDEPASAG